MTHTLSIAVQIETVDIGCDACSASLNDVPVEIADRWLQSHVAPALLVLHVQVNGSPTRWVRRRRTA